MNDVLTPIECAGLLRISRRQLRRLVSARLVPVIKINQRVQRFHKDTVLAALQKRGAK